MSSIKFDVALEVSKLRSDPAIFAIPAIPEGENRKNSKNSKNSNPTPPVGPTPRTDLAPAPDISLGGPSESVRPSREVCQAKGCAAWLSGGKDDPACSWRCIGSIVYDDANPEDAPRPRLVDFGACPHGRLGGTGLDDWPPFPPEDVDFASYENAGSLLDLCRRHGLRVEVTDGRAMIVYPVNAPPALVEYAEMLLAEGRPYVERMRNMVSEMPTGAMQ